LIAQRANLLLWERNADSLLLLLQNVRVAVFDAQNFFLPAALYSAWGDRLQGNHPAARTSFELSRVLLDSVLEELPNDWRVHTARGLTLSGLGLRHEALGEAQWLQQSEIYRTDIYFGGLLAVDRAQILAQAGDTEGALDEIERLLAGPSWLSVHMLRLDPLWDPIRNQSRFKALLTKYAER
jgi:serine/threonine-protein kinase